MSAETIQIVGLLDERILAMDKLAESLSRASAAIVVYDIDSLEARISSQQDLCAGIRDLDLRLEAVQQRYQSRKQQSQTISARSVETQEEKSLSEAMNRLNEAHLRLKSMNKAHAALLHRSRRTIRALSHAYQTVTMEAYSNPTTQYATAEEKA